MDLRFPHHGMPESAAPKLGKVDSLVTMDRGRAENANGVLYALAGFSGGITCYVKDGFLCYEFNLFEVQRTKLKSKEQTADGQGEGEVESKLVDKIGGPMDVTLKVNGKEVGRAECRPPCRCTSRRMRPSISAPTWIRPSRSTTSTKRRLPSTAASARRRSCTSRNRPMIGTMIP
jgi:hypothetical protein